MSSEGHTTCIVCVDLFSKYVVGGTLADKSSLLVASFFCTRILQIFGLLQWVRADNGKEFSSAF